VGQQIEVDGVTVIDGNVVIATNRSLTGTDGEGFASSDDASASDTFPARLAAELFEADGTLTRVYVDQNAIILTRPGTWSDGDVGAASAVIESFFLFYPNA